MLTITSCVEQNLNYFCATGIPNPRNLTKACDANPAGSKPKQLKGNNNNFRAEFFDYFGQETMVSCFGSTVIVFNPRRHEFTVVKVKNRIVLRSLGFCRFCTLQRLYARHATQSIT